MLNPKKPTPAIFAGVYCNTAHPLQKIHIFTTQLFSLFNVLGKWGRLCLQVASLSNNCAKNIWMVIPIHIHLCYLNH